jgi:integrase
MLLSKGSLAAIKREAAEKKKSDYTVWDDELKGFGLRLRNGTYIWIFQYRYDGVDYRIKLGSDPSLKWDKARKLASALRGQVEDAKLGRGIHPAAERERRKAESKPKAKPKIHSFASVIPLYLEARRESRKPLRQSTYEAQERHLNKHWQPLHEIPLASIALPDVAAALTAINKANGPIAANRARATLSKFFRWAMGEGLCAHNPVIGTNKRDESEPRERSLSDAEAATVWLAAPESDYGHIVQLILLTGCRRDEIGSLKWPEIDLKEKTITLPSERTKNKRPHTVPLSDKALTILKAIPQRVGRDFVFGAGEGGYSGWSKAKAAIDKDTGLKEPWTLHDLRRTVRTGLGKLGIQPHIAEATLNHLPPKLIRTYDRNTYAAEKRDALDKWAGHLKVAIAQANGANVTTIRKGRGHKSRH